jgi:hypothetical protein
MEEGRANGSRRTEGEGYKIEERRFKNTSIDKCKKLSEKREK